MTTDRQAAYQHDRPVSKSTEKPVLWSPAGNFHLLLQECWEMNRLVAGRSLNSSSPFTHKHTRDQIITCKERQTCTHVNQTLLLDFPTHTLGVWKHTKSVSTALIMKDDDLNNWDNSDHKFFIDLACVQIIDEYGRVELYYFLRLEKTTGNVQRLHCQREIPLTIMLWLSYLGPG